MHKGVDLLHDFVRYKLQVATPNELPTNRPYCSNSITYFVLIFFTARFAQDAEDAELEVFSFAVERTAKENQSTFMLLQICVYISN